MALGYKAQNRKGEYKVMNIIKMILSMYESFEDDEI